MLAFALAASVGAGVLFGTVPALQASRFDLVRALNEGTSQMGGGFRFRRGNRTRSVLVVAEVALALMLLVGAGLLVRSFVTLATVDPGFDPCPRADRRAQPATIAVLRHDGGERPLRSGARAARSRVPVWKRWDSYRPCR